MSIKKWDGPSCHRSASGLADKYLTKANTARK